MELEPQKIAAILDGIGNVMPPVFVLVCWTLIVSLVMLAVRVPAMQKAKIDAQQAKHTADLKSLLPSNAMSVSDNYNHLHESPTIFYALCTYLALAGGGDAIAGYLAWGYVALRILHSIVQMTINIVLLRFGLFLLSLGTLMALCIREAMRLLG